MQSSTNTVKEKALWSYLLHVYSCEHCSVWKQPIDIPDFLHMRNLRQAL